MTSNRKMTDFFRASTAPRDPPAGSAAAAPHMSQQKGEISTSFTSSVADRSPIPTTSQTSQPAGSQGPPASSANIPSSGTSSRRVVKHGEEVVRPSDSEEDSDSSIEDIGTVLNLKRKRPPEKPSESIQPTPPPTTKSDRWSGLRDRDGLLNPNKYAQKRAEQAPASKPERKLFSMRALVGMSQRAKGTQDRVSRMQMALDHPNPEDEEGEDDEKMQQTLLQSHLKGDEESSDQTANVMQVLERTDVLEDNFRYHLFDSTAPPVRSNPFPQRPVSSGQWITILMDADRPEAFKSGFAASMIPLQSLPPSILLWIIDELSVESDEELLSAYLKVLELSGPQLSEVMNPQKITELFRRVGARDTNTGSPIRLSKELPDAPKRKLSPQLRWTVEFLRVCSQDFSSETLQCSINLLLRTAIDDSVQASGDLSLRVQATLSSLIDAISDDEEMTSLETLIATLAATVPDTLQPAVVSALPSIERRHHLFRRQIALRFFLDLTSNKSSRSSRRIPYPTPASPSTAHRPLPSLQFHRLHDRILTRLTRSQLFCINSETEYGVLAAAVALLDIAIDAGFVSKLPVPASLTADDLDSDSDSSSSESESARLEFEELDATTNSGTRAFNDSLDAITAQVRTIHGQITDGGVMHMNRVEAKEALDRLAMRLEHAVRIGGAKKKADLFVERRQENAMRLGMQSWLKERS